VGGSGKWDRKVEGGRSFNEGSLGKRVLKEKGWQKEKAAESYKWKCFHFLLLLGMGIGAAILSGW